MTSNFAYHVQKTKPTQHSVRGLRSMGLMPNILACRSTTVSLSLSPYMLIHFVCIHNTPCLLMWAPHVSLWTCIVMHFQELDENVKAKLSQFCHVPVTCFWGLFSFCSFPDWLWPKAYFGLAATFILCLSICFARWCFVKLQCFFRIKISSLCMMYPTSGMFLCF